MPWPSDSVLTSQPHPYGKAAFEKVGVRVMSICGGEGGRTPVRRSDGQNLSERSLRFDIPAAGLPQTGCRLE